MSIVTSSPTVAAILMFCAYWGSGHDLNPAIVWKEERREREERERANRMEKEEIRGEHEKDLDESLIFSRCFLR